jgi:flavorubredoxin
MTTTVDEIADGVYRLSTYVRDVEPDGITFNQFLLQADEPLLFHCGQRWLFDDVSHAAARVMPVERLRWVTFGHVEADECGSMNLWLSAAPDAAVAAGEVACEVSLDDWSVRTPVRWGDGEKVDLGGKRVRHIDTPHVPHGLDSRLLFEERSRTLLCGDLFTHTGGGPPVRDDDVVERALASESPYGSICLTPATAPTIRRLADLEPATLAIMHGAAYTGDCREALEALAEGYERRLQHQMS